MYKYNNHGWYCGEAPGGDRATSIAPPAHDADPVVGQLWPNWTGVAWAMLSYAAPVAPTPATPTYGSKITTDAFYRRLTPAERRRMEVASLDPGVAGAARDLAADLRVGQRRLAGAAYFDLALAENIATVQGLATANLLDAPQYGGATRAGEILKTPVSDPGELPGSIRVAYGLPEIPQ